MSFKGKPELFSHIKREHIESNANPEPDDSGRWLVNGQDVTSKFREYRRSSMGRNERCLENHLNEILSLSGIFVLQYRSEYQSIPVEIFPTHLLSSMRREMMTKFSGHQGMSDKGLSSINRILNGFIQGTIDDDSAQIELLKICRDLEEDERHAVRAIAGLIPNLYDCNMQTMSEAQLSSSYVHPFLSGLFASKHPTGVAHCSNLQMANENNDEPKLAKRPDYTVDLYNAYEYAYTTVIGEIKTGKDSIPINLLLDFHRVAICCKKSLDEAKLDTVLGFQAIGDTITFFALTLEYQHMYTFTELASITIPLNKRDILSITGQLSNMVMLSYVHRNFCVPTEQDIDHFRINTSPDSFNIDKENQSSPSKKRKISLGHCEIAM